jgi:membrane fusion protein, copper/silver efflux system
MKKIFLGIVVLGLAVCGLVLGAKREPKRPAASAKQVLYWVDPMHPAYRSDHPGTAPDCGMALEPVYAEATIAASAPKLDSVREEVYRVPTFVVEKTSGNETVRMPGRVVVDQTRIYSVNVGTEGFVRSTYQDDLGNHVKKDQRLADIYSPELLTLAGGFLSASERTQNTANPSGAAAAQGTTGLQNWADRLKNLGLSDSQMEEISQSREIPNKIVLKSPVDGFIVGRNIAPGERYERHAEFYRIADLRKVWVLADASRIAQERLQPGVAARVVSHEQHKAFTAHRSEALPLFDPSTQTLRIRFNVDNPEMFLRPDMYVEVEYQVHLPEGITVPTTAVLDSGLDQRVFVQDDGGHFEQRRVRTGQSVGDRVYILQGLALGERVATAASFFLSSDARLESQMSPER